MTKKDLLEAIKDMPMFIRCITTKNLIRLSYAKRLQLVRLTRKENAFLSKIIWYFKKKEVYLQKI